jgi:hypothetical protein
MSSHFVSSHFGAAHYESSHYGRDVIVVPPPDFTPEPVRPPGSAPYDERARWIEQEDELLMLVIRAFLTMKDRE